VPLDAAASHLAVPTVGAEPLDLFGAAVLRLLHRFRLEQRYASRAQLLPMTPQAPEDRTRSVWVDAFTERIEVVGAARKRIEHPCGLGLGLGLCGRLVGR